MKIVLWILQALLGAAFIMAGFTKAIQPIDQLGPMMPWVNDSPVWLVRFVGISEIAGGLGLILPWLTGIQKSLTPLAGWGLALVMALAAALHISRGEYGGLLPTFVLGGLAAFVAYSRNKELKAGN